MTITSYMTRQGFGDYSRAAAATREEMEDAALAYAAQEQSRPSIFRELGLKQARDRYAADAATAADLRTLVDAERITPEQASDYRRRHRWK